MKYSNTVFAFGRNFTYTYFITNNFNWFFTFNNTAEKKKQKSQYRNHDTSATSTNTGEVSNKTKNHCHKNEGPPLKQWLSTAKLGPPQTLVILFFESLCHKWRDYTINTYSGNCPSTLQTYSFCTRRFLIWCSICLAFFGDRPNNNNPLVRRSNRCIVLKFFKLYSFANINTTVLCRYLPHGWTCNTKIPIMLRAKKKKYQKKSSRADLQA